MGLLSFLAFALLYSVPQVGARGRVRGRDRGRARGRARGRGRGRANPNPQLETSVVESRQKASAVLQSSGMPWLKLRVGSGLKPTRPYST